MHVSGSGPLGVLLMVAPLAAIPVFAIVGVPHFAPVSASGADDDDFAELTATSSAPFAPSAPVPAQARSANDLYAAVKEPVPQSTHVLESADHDRRPSVATAGNRSRGPVRWLPPSEALDQWEVRADVADAPSSSRKVEPADSSASNVPKSTEGLQAAADDLDDGKVSAEGFNPDLLRADHPSPAKKGTRRAVDVPLELPAESRANATSSRNASVAAPVAENVEALNQTLSEQSGWQAAARRLKKLGIRKYRLESQIDEQRFVFICAFASPDNPRVVCRFEADADNPLEAVEQVLKQIDQWRNRDGALGQSDLLPGDEN